jgi:hypothetical protein
MITPPKGVEVDRSLVEFLSGIQEMLADGQARV